MSTHRRCSSRLWSACQARGGKAIIVIRDGKTLGVVTRQGVGELLTMRRAIQETT